MTKKKKEKKYYCKNITNEKQLRRNVGWSLQSGYLLDSNINVLTKD